MNKMMAISDEFFVCPTPEAAVDLVISQLRESLPAPIADELRELFKKGFLLGVAYQKNKKTDKGYIEGLELQVSKSDPDHEIHIAPGRCYSDDDETMLENETELTVTLMKKGENGLDKGAVSHATWYNVWLIYNPIDSLYAGLLSLSPYTPELPPGYIKKRRLGHFYPPKKRE